MHSAAKAEIDASRRAFVVCSDANWLWQSAFVLQQAIDSDPDGELDCYFFTDVDLDHPALAQLFDPRVTTVNVAAELGEIAFQGNAHVPKAASLRFLALDRLSSTHDQVVYVDGDVFLSWGSWTDVFGLPGQTRAVAAVLARPIWFNNPRWRYGRSYRKALCKGMGDRYLNSGVLLVNSDRYRAEQISHRVLRFMEQHPDLCAQGDQSALNAVLEGNWDELSPSWNWQVSPFNFPLLSRFNPRVIHFTGPIKPWNDSNGLFRFALLRMVQFLSDRGATELVSDLQRRHKIDPEWSERRAKFRATWADDCDIKLSRINNYLSREDFVDTAAGLVPFGSAPSHFGGLPLLQAPDDLPNPDAPFRPARETSS